MAFTDRPLVNSISYTENGDAIYPAGPVYSASAVGIASAASTPTDVFTITGSATKNVRVHNIVLTGTFTTTAAVRDILLIKRSTANSGGTSTTPTGIALDSNYAASTAVVRAYTVNPASLGTAVGTVRVRRIGVPLTTAATIDVAEFAFTVPLTLRGVSQVLAINFGATGSASIMFSAYAEWSED